VYTAQGDVGALAWRATPPSVTVFTRLVSQRIPEPAAGLAANREPHCRLRELLEPLNSQGLTLDTLSMGMSAGLEAAIAEGTTVVLVGTAIFGSR
jgi:hypothetical protein